MVDKITNDIKKSRLRWFGHVMWMREERIHKKMLYIKMEGKEPRGRPRTKSIDQIRKDIEMKRGKLRRNTRKQEVGK